MVPAGSGAPGWLDAAGAARLWRAPLAAAVGTALALGAVRLVPGGPGGPVGVPLGAGLVAGLVAAILVFRLLRPGAPATAGQLEIFSGFGVPVMAAIPEMATSRDRRALAVARRRARILLALMIAISAIAAGAVLVRLLQ